MLSEIGLSYDENPSVDSAVERIEAILKKEPLDVTAKEFEVFLEALKSLQALKEEKLFLNFLDDKKIQPLFVQHNYFVDLKEFLNSLIYPESEYYLSEGRDFFLKLTCYFLAQLKTNPASDLSPLGKDRCFSVFLLESIGKSNINISSIVKKIDIFDQQEKSTVLSLFLNNFELMQTMLMEENKYQKQRRISSFLKNITKLEQFGALLNFDAVLKMDIKSLHLLIKKISNFPFDSHQIQSSQKILEFLAKWLNNNMGKPNFELINLRMILRSSDVKCENFLSLIMRSAKSEIQVKQAFKVLNELNYAAINIQQIRRILTFAWEKLFHYSVALHKSDLRFFFDAQSNPRLKGELELAFVTVNMINRDSKKLDSFFQLEQHYTKLNHFYFLFQEKTQGSEPNALQEILLYEVKAISEVFKAKLKITNIDDEPNLRLQRKIENLDIYQKALTDTTGKIVSTAFFKQAQEKAAKKEALIRNRIENLNMQADTFYEI